MGQATDNTPLIRIEHAGRVFRMGEVEVAAVADADLSIAPGELIVVLGPSGSGKSTLLNLIGAMDRPTSGRVLYGNLDLTAQSEPALTDFRRRKLGFIFQFYNLVPTLTARENVQVASELVRGALDPLEALGLVGLADRAEHFPAQLSGGEQQRVAIARALANEPALLLADEPTGNLDPSTSDAVFALLLDICRETGAAALVATHNHDLASRTDATLELSQGKLRAIG